MILEECKKVNVREIKKVFEPSIASTGQNSEKATSSSANNLENKYVKKVGKNSLLQCNSEIREEKPTTRENGNKTTTNKNNSDVLNQSSVSAFNQTSSAVTKFQNFISAIKEGNCNKVRAILDNNKEIVNLKGKDWKTPLHIALEQPTLTII